MQVVPKALGQGATSEVFVVHPKIPISFQGSRKAFALRRAVEVIKIKSALVFKKINLERAARYFRNDLSRYKLAEELVKHVTFKGQRLLEVAELLSTREEHAMAVLRQRVAPGPSMDQIQNQLDVVLRRRKATIPEYIYAVEFLKETGIATPGGNNTHLEHLEIQAKVNAVESFYRQSEGIVLEFVRQNKLENYGGIPKGGTQADQVAVGFDFNHGSNVTWDSKARVFRMIDF